MMAENKESYEVDGKKWPFCCPEENCKCINSTSYYPQILKEGYGFVCFGRIIDPEQCIFQAGEKKIIHRNTHHFCIWSPLKGWFKFMVNKDDMRLIEVIIENWKKIKDSRI